MDEPKRPRRRRRAPSTSWYVGRAVARAKKLGPLKPVTPETSIDGFPVLRDGEVYVFGTGAKYHTELCSIVESMLEWDPERVKVTELVDVGDRQECQVCIDEAEYDALAEEFRDARPW